MGAPQCNCSLVIASSMCGIPFCLLQVGPEGKVVGIDHIKELVDDAINNVKKDDPSLITSGRVTLKGKTRANGRSAVAHSLPTL